MVIVDLAHARRWNAISERVAKQNRAAIKIEPLRGLNPNIGASRTGIFGEADPPNPITRSSSSDDCYRCTRK
jgi:hypothetical protein